MSLHICAQEVVSKCAQSREITVLLKKKKKCEVCCFQKSSVSNELMDPVDSILECLLTGTNNEVYECEVCLKNFCYKSSLKTHMLIHTGEKPHECELCAKRFAQRGQLKSHLLTHTGEKPNECELCLRKFAHKSSLRCHLLSHRRKRARVEMGSKKPAGTLKGGAL